MRDFGGFHLGNAFGAPAFEIQTRVLSRFLFRRRTIRLQQNRRDQAFALQTFSGRLHARVVPFRKYDAPLGLHLAKPFDLRSEKRGGRFRECHQGLTMPAVLRHAAFLTL